MIPGNAFHVIDSVDASQIMFDDFMRTSLFYPLTREISSRFSSLHNKAWFIKNLKCLNYQTSGLPDADGVLNIDGMVVSKVAKLGEIPVFDVLFKLNNEYYRLFVKHMPRRGGFFAYCDDSEFLDPLLDYRYSTVVEWKKITNNDYFDAVESIKNNAFPRADALRDASGGNEDVETLNSAYKDFISSLKLQELIVSVRKGLDFGEAIKYAQSCMRSENDEIRSNVQSLFEAAEKYLDDNVLVFIKNGKFDEAKSCVEVLPDEIVKISNKFPFKEAKFWFKSKNIPMLKNKLITIAVSWVSYDLNTAAKLLKALFNNKIVPRSDLDYLLDSMRNRTQMEDLKNLLMLPSPK